MRSVVLLAALLLSSCFDPKLGQTPFRCGDGTPKCPSGYQCVGGICRNDQGQSDGGGADAPRAADARPAIDARPAVDGTVVAVPDARPPPDGFVCFPGAFAQCQSDSVALFCVEGGGFEARDCAFRCNAELRRCEQCDPSRAQQCSGDQLVTCSADGTIVSVANCAGFCEDEVNSGSGARCATLEPTNLPTDLCDAPAAKPRRITADIDIDTTTCADGRKVSQSGGSKDICLLEYTDFVIEAGVLVRAVGDLPLAIAADTMTISGAIDASGTGIKPGAGAANQGTGGTTDGVYSNAGGGGGFGTAGAKGGTEDVLITVAGGSAYGDPSLAPLIGGSAGGRAGASPQICTVNCPTIAAGGGGGGALQLVACKSMTFTVLAQLRAAGGGGAGGFQAYLPSGTTLTTAGGGGGGGSGGAILLESPSIDIGIAAFFVATGGGGGGGGGLEQGTNGGAGEDGQPDRPASGGGRGSPYAGRGGAGGTRDAAGVYGVAPVDGETVQKPHYGAGAGGGAAGRIRMNTAPSSPLDPRTFISLPYPSIGAIKGR